MEMVVDPGDGQDAPAASGFGDDVVVEVGLVLPARQLAAFEEKARRQGLTAGQMLRLLLGGFLGQDDPVSQALAPSPPRPARVRLDG
jgi:hypothetical protein